MNIDIISRNSVKLFGGASDDYRPVHDFIAGLCTETSPVSVRIAVHNKEFMHYVLNALLNTSGIQNSDGKWVEIQKIGEAHLRCVYGFLPVKSRWAKSTNHRDWMNGVNGFFKDYKKIISPRERPSLDQVVFGFGNLQKKP